MSFERKELTIFLSPASPDIRVPRVVYQDQMYDFIFEIDKKYIDFCDIEFLVNDEEIEIKLEKVSEEISVLKYKASPVRQKPFELVFGFVIITIRLFFDGQREESLFSEYLAVAVQKGVEKKMESIQKMLHDIYKKNHKLLYKEKLRNGNILPQYLRLTDDRYEGEKTLLQTLLQVLNQNLPYFRHNKKCKAVAALRIDSVDKLHRITCENLQYIVTHPEELKPSSGVTGIFINKKAMLPNKTLVSIHKFTSDTFENRVILSFIDHLIKHIKNRVEMLKGLSFNPPRPVETLKENYILTTSILKKYIQISLGDYSEIYENLLSQFRETFLQYHDALVCSQVEWTGLPPPTPTFLEVWHYRDIYQRINTWFSLNDFDSPSREKLLHFPNASTIYEYYCLLNLYDVIISLGYIEDSKSLYEYKISHLKYKNTKDVNTFHFSRGREKLIFYYQPVIHSRTFHNDITLFRTDKSYFAPDFILKKVLETGEVSYGIIDAKWRGRSVLMKRTDGAFSDMAYKYFFSIVDSKTLLPCRFFWLLQGRDDEHNTYFHHSGKLSKSLGEHFNTSSGIAKVTPDSGISELTQILRIFLSQPKT